MPEAKSAGNKKLIVKLAVLGVLVVIAGVLVLHGVNLRVWVLRGMAIIRQAGPWAFFSAMAILPAFGAPLMAFALTAGPAFSGRLGIPGVLVAYAIAIGVNIALTYWLARFAVRPWVERLVERMGYQIPQFDEEEQFEVTLLLRVTPGPPFFVQSYLLGLGNVAFFTYLWISWAIAMIYAVGFVVFGDAIIHGKGGMAVSGVSLVIAVLLVTHLVRKHLGRRRKRG